MRLLAVSDGPGYISVLQKMPCLGCFVVFFLFFFFFLQERKEQAKDHPISQHMYSSTPQYS